MPLSFTNPSPLRVVGFLLISFLLISCSEATEQPVVDVRISGGMVIDGTPQGGNPEHDIEIVANKIIYVGPARNSASTKVIDASGLVVSPGFIDPHTHAEDDLLSAERSSNEPYLRQGVTTVFFGNDGGAGSSVSEFAKQLNARQLGTNVGLWSGHGTIRSQVIGPSNRAPTDEELIRMQNLVAQDMQAGALGLSTGLFYPPGSFATTAEVISLAKVAAKYGGIYESHIRDESNYSIGLLSAIEEVLDIGREADIATHIAHIKALGPAVHSQSREIVTLIEDARAAGQKVSADQYPWLASGTRLSNALVPREAMKDGRPAMHQELRTAEGLEALRPAMIENLARRGGAEALLITGQSPYQGSTLAEAAQQVGKDPIDIAAEIISSGDPAVASFMMSADDVEYLMSQDWVVTGSDGSKGHPRKYATFPEKYQTYVLDKPLLSITEFVHRSTGLTADIFSLCNRGRIAEGYIADIVMWHPDEFAPMASYDAPARLSKGVQHLLVNGNLSIESGELLNAGYGEILNHQHCVQAD